MPEWNGLTDTFRWTIIISGNREKVENRFGMGHLSAGIDETIDN
jgi:hypothetical protein